MAAGRREQIDELQGSILRALSSAHRVRLVHLLAGGPREVHDISECLGIGQAAASQHLAALRAVGLVEARRDGRSVAYGLSDPDVAVACGLMREVLIRRLRRLGRLATAAGSIPAHPSSESPVMEAAGR